MINLIIYNKFLNRLCHICVFLLIAVFSSFSSNAALQPQLEDTPYVILVSIDGFRQEYLKQYKPPYLSKQLLKTSPTTALVPVFPSSTFPNHLSLVTGQYPENHGIIDNTFYDQTTKKSFTLADPQSVRDHRWYEGEALWTSLKKLGVPSASFFWPGSDVFSRHKRPTYSRVYRKNASHKEMIEQMITWLNLPAKERPHFLTLYFSSVDMAGHKFGPNSLQVREAIHKVDGSIATLDAKLQQLPFATNLIVVSDHGMSSVSPENILHLPASLQNSSDFIVRGGGTLIHLYKKHQRKHVEIPPALQKIKGLKIYSTQESPEVYHYKKHKNIGDYIIEAQYPYYMVGKQSSAHAPPKGAHGYDPQNPKMHGIFLTRGPKIKSGFKIPPFEIIHIYPFILKLLNLPIHKNIDGDKDFLANLLLK